MASIANGQSDRERSVNATSFDDLARQYARTLEDREALSNGQPITKARESVARRIGVPPGTLENLRRQRIKGIRAWIFERLRTAYEADCERQLKLLEHELEITRSLAPTAGVSLGEAEAIVRADRGKTREA